jgi:hypothetical protein
MPFPYSIILGRETAMLFPYSIILGRETAMLFPYSIILGRQTCYLKLGDSSVPIGVNLSLKPLVSLVHSQV